LENPQLISFAHAWRSSRTMRSAAQVICHCWMDEEVRLGSPRNNGLFTNLLHPLGKHNWPDGISRQEFPTLAESVGGSSFEDSEVIDTEKSRIVEPSLSGSQHVQKHKPAVEVEPGHIPLEVRRHAMEIDSRVILARILELLTLLDTDVCFVKTDIDDASGSKQMSTAGSITSFSELGLTPGDKQVLSIAKRFDTIKCGEYWNEVYEELSASSTPLIDSDQSKIQFFLKEYFNAASIISLEQSELDEMEQDVKREESENFVNKILDQKQQQIKAEWIKRNSKKKQKSSMQ